MYRNLCKEEKIIKKKKHKKGDKLRHFKEKVTSFELRLTTDNVLKNVYLCSIVVVTTQTQISSLLFQ